MAFGETIKVCIKYNWDISAFEVIAVLHRIYPCSPVKARNYYQPIKIYLLKIPGLLLLRPKKKFGIAYN